MKNIQINPWIGVMFLMVILQSQCSIKDAKADSQLEVVTNVRTVVPFTEIEISGVFNVILEQGSVASIKIETEQSAQSAIITEVKDNKLMVSMKEGFDFDHIRKKNIYITLNQITKIKNSGVGNLETKGILKLKELRFESSSVGNTELNIAVQKFTTEISNVGNITLKGSSNEAYINKKGVGNLYAFEFEVAKLDLNFSGVGNTEVYATKELYIDNSAVGNLSYKGDAALKKLEHVGVGKIKKF